MHAVAHQHPLPDDLIELIASRFRLLGEPVRIKLLDALRQREANVQELTTLTATTQQNVSKHLGALRTAGIVGRRKEGNYSYYFIADHSVFELCEHVCGALETQVDALRTVVSRPAA